MKLNLKAVNLALIALIIASAINLIVPIHEISGDIAYGMDTSEPECHFSYNNELNEIPMGLCCHEIQKQLACKPIDNSGLKCYTSEDSGIFYLINDKAFMYCQREGYDVRAGQ